MLLQTASYAPPTAAAAPKKPAETKKPVSTPSTAAAAMFAKKPKAEPKLKREDSKPKKEESPETEAKVKVESTKEPTGEKATAAAAAAKKTQKDFFSNWNAANRKAKDKKAESQSNSFTHSPAPGTHIFSPGLNIHANTPQSQ